MAARTAARNGAYVPGPVLWVAPHAAPTERDDPIRLQIGLGKATRDVRADQQDRLAAVVRAEMPERLGKEQQITQPVRGDNGYPAARGTADRQQYRSVGERKDHVARGTHRAAPRLKPGHRSRHRSIRQPWHGHGAA